VPGYATNPLSSGRARCLLPVPKPNEDSPILWVILNLVKSASSFSRGALSDRLGRRAAILAGWGVYVVAYAGFAFANAPWQIWLLFAFYGVFYGLTESPQSALVVDLVEQDWRGRALGTYNAVIGLATLSACLIFIRVPP
jgi:MFS family permease